MMKLTKRRIDGTRPASTDTFLWCDATPGFGARVYPSGKVVFIAQVRVGRSQRRVKIGPYGPWTVDKAREEADEIIRAAGRGIDPQAEKRERRDAMTISELCDEYLVSAEAGQVLTRFGRPKAKRTIADDQGRVAREL